MASCLSELLNVAKMQITHVRSMGKFVRRNVMAIYKDEEEYKEKLKKQQKEKMKPKKQSPDETKVEQDFKADLPSKLAKLRYEKLGRNSRRNFANILHNMKASNYRNSHNMYLLHGENLIKQAMEAGSYIRSIYFSQMVQLESLSYEILRKTNLFHVPEHLFKEAHGGRRENLYALATQQDEATRKKITKKRLLDKDTVYLPITVVCSNIENPKTVGELLRIAAACGCAEVFVLEGCVDIWNMEVLKAARGAHFRIPVVPLPLPALQDIAHREQPQKVIIAAEKQPSPLTLQDCVNPSVYQEVTKSTSFIQLIRKESQVGNKEEVIDLSRAEIPAVNCNDLSFQPASHTLAIFGYMDYDLFELAATLQHSGSDCSVMRLPLVGDDVSFTMQAAVLLQQARRQILTAMNEQA